MDQVVSVDRFIFRGHAYDFQTEQGFYALNGILVHNCRHRVTAYQAGDPVPTMPSLSEEQNQRDYDASQRQRAMERTLRKWKRREAAALTPQERQQAKAKIWEWKNEIKAHVDAHPHQTRDKFRESVHRERH
ncbi:phage minor capsid protein [Corynebacterium sp. HMSC065A05]|uniref:phage minor capsid protein n=1 Tax=Corynebacterium sp. HMSC065A05 TaxID=1739502 RepID=UPI00352B2501